MEDRDLWKWELPNSPEVSAALESHPKDFSVWDQLDARELAREGKTILRHNRLQVERIVQHSALQDIVGWRVPAVNTPLLASEACEALLENFPGAPFAAAYADQRNRRKWSLRSSGEFDVTEVAQLMGGGGHHHAAGFLEDI